jgi:hypothetical protein
MEGTVKRQGEKKQWDRVLASKATQTIGGPCASDTTCILLATATHGTTVYIVCAISLYLSPLIVLFRSQYPNFAPRCNRISLGTLERSELSFFSDNSDAKLHSIAVNRADETAMNGSSLTNLPLFEG